MSSDKEIADGVALLLELESSTPEVSKPSTAIPSPSSPIPSPFPPDTHSAMVELIIANPDWKHAQYARHFGRTAGWFAGVLASDNFQSILDPRRHEVLDPTLTATMEERFRSLTLRSLEVLSVKLESPGVQDATVLKAMEIGVKALGMGQAKKDEATVVAPRTLNSLADDLVQGMLQAKARVASGQFIDIIPEDSQ